jgi:hypothetical protein
MTTTYNGNLIATKAPNLPTTPIDYSYDYQNQVMNAFRLYFTTIDNFTQATVVPASGTTANRPLNTTKVPLLTGKFYFDTTLGKPIWWNGSVWKDASGNTV